MISWKFKMKMKFKHFQVINVLLQLGPRRRLGLGHCRRILSRQHDRRWGHLQLWSFVCRVSGDQHISAAVSYVGR